MPHSDFLNSAPSIQRAFLQGGRKIVIQNVEFSCSLLVFLTGRVFLTQFALPELFFTLSFPTDEPFVRSSSLLAERGGLAGHTHITFALSGESRESKNGQILLTYSAIDVDEGD